nr:MAG TPA: hypothetical protein [Caudoviricetes sp.]
MNRRKHPPRRASSTRHSVLFLVSSTPKTTKLIFKYNSFFNPVLKNAFSIHEFNF